MTFGAPRRVATARAHRSRNAAHGLSELALGAVGNDPPNDDHRDHASSGKEKALLPGRSARVLVPARL